MNEQMQISEAYNRFRARGWAPGGQCAIALLSHVTDNSKKIYVTPDYVKDAQLASSDLFLLRDLYGIQDIQTPLNQINQANKISRWSSVLLEILSRNTTNLCAVQLTPLWSTLAGRHALTNWAKKGDSHPNVLRLTYWKLLEKLTFDGSADELSIPIISYGKPEETLFETKEALKLYPHTCAIVIRDYGILAWGKTLADVQNRVEILEHLCQLQIQDFILFEKANSV